MLKFKLDPRVQKPIKQVVLDALHKHGCPTKIDQDLIYMLHEAYPRMSVLYPYKVVE